MALVKITPPPGVVKPGTIYQAMGRWFHTFMVRWHEGVMQAIPGWEPEVLAGALSPNDVIVRDDSGSQSGHAAAIDLDDDDTPVSIFAAAAVDDALYIGGDATFPGVTFRMFPTHVAGDWTVVYEYWDGSAWTALTAVLDSTAELTFSGTSTIAWTEPGDWDLTTVDGVERYWVRIRVTASVNPVTLSVTKLFRGSMLALGEVVRGTHSWQTAAGAPRLAVGTPTKLYIVSAGVIEDVTPSGFTTGQTDASATLGAFGAGPFGVGPFGVGQQLEESITEAQTWQFDNYGEDLVAVAYSDGDLILYDTSTGNQAAAVTNAPTTNAGVVVTPERFVLALGAGGDSRKIQWPDVDDITAWTPSSTNFAGDINLPGEGAILAGWRTNAETLVWTTTEVFAIRFIGGEFVYAPVAVGTHGAISRRSMVVDGSLAYWMSQKGFYFYDGYEQTLPCEVSDYVFSDLNESQASKIWTEMRAEYGEITWHYPSGSSVECDRSVTYNAKGRFWYVNEIARTAGEDRSPWPVPIAFGPDGVAYRHEVGSDYADMGEEAALPYAECGPFELGNGDTVMDINYIIPDEKSRGQVSLTIFTSYYPTEDEVENGPYTPANPTSVRLNGRLARLRVDQVDQDWRLGVVRLDVQPGGGR